MLGPGALLPSARSGRGYGCRSRPLPSRETCRRDNSGRSRARTGHCDRLGRGSLRDRPHMVRSCAVDGEGNARQAVMAIWLVQPDPTRRMGSCDHSRRGSSCVAYRSPPTKAAGLAIRANVSATARELRCSVNSLGYFACSFVMASSGPKCRLLAQRGRTCALERRRLDARKRRLLREAQARFEERVALAQPRERRSSAAWR